MVTLDPYDALLHFVDGRNRPGDAFGPVLPRVKVERPVPTGPSLAVLPVKGAPIPLYVPSERRMALESHPVADWVGDQFSGGVSPSEDKTSEHVHVRHYSPPNWFTASGVAKKRQLIEAKGLPSFRLWRFFTLTLNRDRFDGPLEGYLAAKDHMRRFLNACRKAKLWKPGAKWCWKLEFHKDGWPHWHLLVERREIYSHDQLREVERLWALGSTKCLMVQEDDFLYSFKYAFKAVIQRDEDGNLVDDDALCAPEWFLDYAGEKLVRVEHPLTKEVTHELKPFTFAKVRFWQTSKDFYTGERPQVIEDRPVQVSWVVPVPARFHVERSQCLVQIVARRRSGKYEASGVFCLSCDRYELWKAGSRAHTYDDGLAIGVYDYFLPVRELKRKTDKNQLWKLQPLLNRNQLPLRRARTLQRLGKCWKTS